MPDVTLAPVRPLALPPGRYGRPDGEAGVRICLITGRALVHVAARRGCDDEVAAIAASRFGATMPTAPSVARGPKVAFLWSGHRQWLAMADEADVPDLAGQLRAEFGAKVSLTDQSDSRCIVALAGPKARATLARLLPIDLHPRAFAPSQTALTLFGHIAGQITQIDDNPRYELMVFRGFAESFWRSICEAGAEFGVEVVPDPEALVAGAMARVE